MKPLSFAWRSLRREFRYGELTTLAAALVLAVAALGAVATLGLRVERALVASAAELIGGDVGVGARQPLPPQIRSEALRLGLAVSESADFPTVVFANDASQMVAVRASDAAYPLRGDLRIRDAHGRERVAKAPGAGEILLDHRVLVSLRLRVGDDLSIAGTRVRVAGEIVREPDGGQLFALAPRAVMARSDVDASGLLGPGSRARYRLMVAGADDALAAFQSWLQANLPEGAELITVARSQQNLRTAFERGEAFLRLAALLAALLSGVAVALAAQRYARRKVDEVALLRCLGASRREVLAATALTLTLLALPACAFGALLGIALQEVVFALARELLPGAAPALVFGPSVAAFAVGLAVLFGFALPPLLRLGDVPPIRVFQRAAGVRVRRFDLLYLLPVAVSAALIYQQSGTWRVAAALSGALGAVTLGTLLAAAVVIALANRFGRRLPGALRFGVANLARRRGLSLVQSTALALALTALSLLAIVAPSMLAAWRAELPPDTPNYFLINLQDEQRIAVSTRLLAAGATGLNMMPLAGGKLIAINGKVPPKDDEGEDRGGGETRVSWSATLPEANKLVSGRWFPVTPTEPEISVEKFWVDRYGIKLGDRITLGIAEREVVARVTSVRVVNWDSFRVNFFLLLDPATARDLPRSNIASFHLPAGSSAALATLTRDFPGLSLFDINALLERVREIIDRVTSAVTWVLGFSLLAGLLVLAAALSATSEERRFEAALLRTLGARRGQLSAAVLGEFTLLGLLAGGIAAAGAGAAGHALAHSVFKFDYTAPVAPLVLAALAATVVVALAGWLGTRRVSRAPPLLVLRKA